MPTPHVQMPIPHVLAVEAPGLCSESCLFCRTGRGRKATPANVKAVIDAARFHLDTDHVDEVYLTGIGEPGLSPAFDPIVEMAQERDIPIAVLCATPSSVRHGLSRIEASLSAHRRKDPLNHEQPLAAIKMATSKEYQIPTIVAAVDTGRRDDPMINRFLDDPEGETIRLGAQGWKIGGQQPEGDSWMHVDRINVGQLIGAKVGLFPADVYGEFARLTTTMRKTCISATAQITRFLGGAPNFAVAA